MLDLSRAQIAVYAAVGVALLLLGARSIRAEGSEERELSFPAGGERSISVESGGSDLVVHVTGAVAQPGVYRLPAGARVTDAVRRAGGAEGGALLEAINLAARLADGQQVVVPKRGPGGVAMGVAGAGGEDGPISLGTASAEQLEEIDGIGPVTAGKILEYRDRQGGLASVEQLDQVSGIGPATMDSLRQRLQP